VELFSLGRFLVAVGRELDIVTQAETIEPYLALRKDLLRTTYAYYVAELADAFTAELDENRPVFDLLKDAFGWLCSADDLALAARYYELHLLGLVGYQPQLYLCTGCKRRLEPEANYLSAADGGAYCPRCGRSQAGTREISLNALKVLRFLQSREWEVCRLLRLSAAGHAEVEEVMGQYIVYHLERRLKSVDFLYRIQRQAAAPGRLE
jgi:DNA repair protein RecO (recombination protein O)